MTACKLTTGGAAEFLWLINCHTALTLLLTQMKTFFVFLLSTIISTALTLYFLPDLKPIGCHLKISRLNKQYLYLKKVEMALDAYYQDCNSYPHHLSQLVTSDEACALSPYSRKNEIIDVFGSPLHYQKHKNSYVLKSIGLDQLNHSNDDINAQDNDIKKRLLDFHYKNNEKVPILKTVHFSTFFIFIHILSNFLLALMMKKTVKK